MLDFRLDAMQFTRQCNIGMFVRVIRKSVAQLARPGQASFIRVTRLVFPELSMEEFMIHSVMK